MKVTVEVEMTPKVLAGAFCDLDEFQQATFFEEVAKAAARWPPAPGYGGPGMQWFRIGRVIRASDSIEAREVVRQIAEGFDP